MCSTTYYLCCVEVVTLTVLKALEQLVPQIARQSSCGLGSESASGRVSKHVSTLYTNAPHVYTKTHEDTHTYTHTHIHTHTITHTHTRPHRHKPPLTHTNSTHTSTHPQPPPTHPHTSHRHRTHTHARLRRCLHLYLWLKQLFPQVTQDVSSLCLSHECWHGAQHYAYQYHRQTRTQHMDVCCVVSVCFVCFV